MKNYIFPLLFLIGFVYFSYAQTVTIGSQIWMTKNLDVSTFRNGDPIPEAKSDQEWLKAGENKQPAWCYYENNPANGAKYGKLYNWFAVNDPRGLAPVGYHIPSDKEWTILSSCLGGENAAGNKMKSTNGWAENGNANNSSGFSGLPGGHRSISGKFFDDGKGGYWWSSTEDGTGGVWLCVFYYNSGDAIRDGGLKKGGISVRCVKD